MAVANTKCQAKNPLACRDPHCPEKRYNLKYTLTLLIESEEKIKQSKKDKTFVGQHKEELELNQQSIINWHNELLAESKIDGKKAEEYIATVKAKYESVKAEKEELENQLSISDMEANIPIVKEIEKVDARLKEIQAEFPDAYRSFYATWEGQQHLLKKLAHYKKTSPNRKAEIANLKKQIIEGQDLHEKQILATVISDENRSESNLPIVLNKIIDSKILNEEEQKQYKEWASHNRGIVNSDFVSSEKRFDSTSGEYIYVLKESVADKGTIVPEFVVKSLYLLPDSTSHANIWKEEYLYAEKKKDSVLVKDVNSPENQDFLRKKYDFNILHKYVK